MVYCQNCGAKNVDDAKFCAQCGAEIKGVEKKETKQQIREVAPEQPVRPSQPARPSPKSSLSTKVFIVALIVVAVVVSFSVVILVANPFSSSGNGGKSSSGNTVTLLVQEFYTALNISINTNNYTCYSDVMGSDAGDVLRIVGKIEQFVGNHDEEIGEYTSILLYNPNGSNLLVHCWGNVTSEYDSGDYVVITLHMIERYGRHEDLYGATWLLAGEFMREAFVDGKFAFDLIIPQNQIKEI